MSCGAPVARDSGGLLGPGLYNAGLRTGALEQWADPNHKATIADLRERTDLRWSRHERAYPTFGYTMANHWFRFQVSNPGDRDRLIILRVGFEHIDHIEVHAFQGEAAYYSAKTGREYPFQTRPIAHRRFAFPLTLPPGESSIIISARSRHTLNVPILLLTETEYHDARGAEQIRLGVYFGVMVFMIFLNALFYYAFRDHIFGYYIFYVFFSILTQLAVHGLAFMYLWPNAPAWNAISLTVMTAAFGISTLLFCRRFLGLGLHLPVINFLFNLMIGAGVFTVLSLLFLPLGRTESLINALMSLSMFLMAYAGVRMLLKGNRAARFYIIGWGIFFALTYVYLSQNLGFVPNGYYGGIDMYEFLLLGVVAEVVLFPVAIADRIRTIVHEHRERGDIQLRARTSRLTRLDLGALHDRLMNVMRESRPYRQNLTLGKLARMVGVGEKDLSEFLNEAERKSFYRFVNEFRVREACDLLTRDADRKILEIAHDVGFQSLSAFNNAFQKTMAMSPRDYRNRSGTA